WWALAAFAVAALTDLVDGWLARRLREVSRWGQLADPLADKALVIGTLAALAVRGGAAWWWWVLVVVVAREVGVTVQRQALLRRGLVMPASVFGKLKTVSQLVAVLMLLAPPTPPWLGLTALGVAVALTILSGAEYVFRGRRLVRAG
ncbi:MAG: CDP-alcohol phosphatidyltransferase family protein, partial [Actinobacteria bacterium]|nr:CDP-alcohol phosphatidyltransferase family protein [Actinomycetota bacterium]